MHKEVENFLRIAILIIQYIKSSLISLVDLDLSNKSLTFEQFINQHQHDIYHLCFNKSKCCQCGPGRFQSTFNRQHLHQPQLKELFDVTNRLPGHVPRSYPTYCCSYARKGISTTNLDVTLARTLLVNFCNDVFWFSCTTAKQQTLEGFLNQNKHVIYHLWRYNMKCCQCQPDFQFPADSQLMDQTQWNIIYTALLLPCIQDRKRPYSGSGSVCAVSATPGIQRQHLSKSLQDALLRFCCPLKKTVDIFIEMRNIRYAHIKDATIPDDEYIKFKTDIESGILEIASIIGNETEVRHALHDLEQRTLDETLCVQYQNSLLCLIGEKENLKADIAALHEFAESHAQDMSKVTSSLENRLRSVEKLVDTIKETSKRSRLIALTDIEIDNHLDEQTFVATKVVKNSVEILEKNSCLLITGAAGTGKSRNCLEILHQFRKRHPEFDFVKLTKLQDFEDIALTSDKIVILFEDIFGRTNYRYTENVDTLIIDRLQACVKKGNIKVIFTIRDTIKRSCDWLLESNQCFYLRCEINLSSEQYKMSREERETLLLKYLNAYNFVIVDFEEAENYQNAFVLNPNVTVKINRVTLNDIVESDPLLGFPEACSLFARNRTFTRLGLKFFKHPSKHLTNEMETLRKNGKDKHQDKLRYVTLLYILVNEGILDIHNIDMNKCLDLMRSCYTGQQEILECDIVDAASEMTGRYLTHLVQSGDYSFQHQTVLESVLISYSKVDQKIVLSMLNFDFIRELVRLQHYQEKEGEVVLRVALKNYKQLAARILEIVQTPFFQRSLPLNMQLLCDSQIVRQDDNEFINNLIKTSHDAYFTQSDAFFTYITVNNETKSVKFYFPTEFMKYIAKQTETKNALKMTLQHITNMFRPSTDQTLWSTCKFALIEAFLEASQIENNEQTLDYLMTAAKECDKIEDQSWFFGSVFDKRCARFPYTTMKWLVDNVIKGDNELFDLQKILNQACEFKRLDIVQLLCNTFNNEDFDFTEALVATINNVWNDPNQEIFEYLLSHIDTDLIDMAKVMQVTCDAALPINVKYLLKRGHNTLFDLKAVFQKASSRQVGETAKELMEWIVTNVPKTNLDLTTLMDLTIKFEWWEVMITLFDQFGCADFDMTKVMKDILYQSIEQELLTLILEKIDHKTVNWEKVVNEASDKGYFLAVKLLLSMVDHGIRDYTHIMMNACVFKCNEQMVTWFLENIDNSLFALSIVLTVACKCDNLDLVKLLLEKNDKSLFDLKTAMLAACDYRNKKTVTWLLENIDNSLFDLSTLLTVACEWDNLDFVKWLLKNIINSLFDLKTAMHAACDNRNEKTVTWLVENIDNSLFDLSTLLIVACKWYNLDLVKLLLENNDKSLFDLKTAMHAACDSRNEKTVTWLVENIDNSLFDLSTVLTAACKWDNLDLVKMLLENNDKSLFDLKTAMHAVCDYRSAKTVTWLLDNIDNSLFDLSTLLTVACKCVDLNLVKWLLENNDKSLFDLKTAMHAACDYRNKKTVTWLVENIDNSLFDLSTLLIVACKWYNLDLVKLLLENNDKSLFDLKTVMHAACDSRNEKTVTWLVENIDNSLFDLSTVLTTACKWGNLDLVKMLLENNDKSLFDLKTAMHAVCDYRSEKTVTWLLDNIDNSLFDLSTLLTVACKCDNLDLVKWLLENNDKSLFDLKTAMRAACFYRNKKTMTWLVDNIDNSLFDLSTLLTIACKCDNRDLVKLLLENNDKSLFDLKTAMHAACYYRNKKTVTWLVENIDNSLFDLSTLLTVACKWYNLDLVKLLLENNDKSLFDLKTVINELLNADNVEDNEDYGEDDIESSEDNDIDVFENDDIKEREDGDMKECKDNYKEGSNVQDDGSAEGDEKDSDGDKETDGENSDGNDEMNSEDSNDYYILQLLHNPGDNTFDYGDILNRACSLGYFNIVKWLVDHCDHSTLDIDISLRHALHKGRCHRNKIIIYILQNVRHDMLDLTELMHEASRIGRFVTVEWLLSHTDTNVYDMNKLFSVMCRHGQLRLVIRLWQNGGHNTFDLENAMNKACRGVKTIDVIKWLLRRFNIERFDMQHAMLNACRYGNTEVVKLFLEKFDVTPFNIKETLNITCCHGNLDTVQLLLQTADTKLIDFQQATMAACGNHNYDLRIIHCLVKHSDKAALDINEIICEACKVCKPDLVQWLINNTEAELLNIKQIMECILKLDANNVLNTEIHNSDIAFSKGQLVLCLLKKWECSLIDVNMVLISACRNGWLDVVKWLWEKSNKQLMHMRQAINESCEYAQYNIADWALNNIDIESLDVKTVMTESCACGWLSNVKWLWTNSDKSVFDMKSSMVEACTYSRLDVVKWLLDNVDREHFDNATLMNDACKNGWTDIINWIIQKNDNRTYNIQTAIQESITYGHKEIIELLFKIFGRESFDLPNLSLPMCSQSSRSDVVLFILSNFDHIQLDITAIMKKACWDGWTDVVEFVLKHVSHSKIDWNEPLLNTCTSGECQITTLLLDNIHHDKFDVNLALLFVCRHGWEEIASVLLDKVNHSKFDFKKAIGEASRCGETDIIKMIFQKVDTEVLDVMSTVKLLCTNKTNENLICWIFANDKVKSFDYDSIRAKARENGWWKLESELKK